MPGGPDDWDDERLAAAFAARSEAGPVPPVGLAAVTIERLRSERRRGPLFGRVAMVASASTVVVVAALGLVVFGSGFLVGRTPEPSAPASGSATPTFATAPASAVGSPTTSPSPGPDVAVSVSRALAFRDSSPDAAGEIRVTGWIRGGIPIPCPAVLLPGNPTRLDCTQAHPWLVESPDDAGPGGLNEQPAGPGFQPSFALVDTEPFPALQPGSSGRLTGPVEVTVTGHFHDRRAPLCPAFSCASTFVVDRIDSVGSVAVGVRTSYLLSVLFERGNTVSSVELPRPAAADLLDAALEHVTGFANPLRVINRRVMSTEALLDAEPGLSAGWSGIGTARVVTALTAIEIGEGSGPPLSTTFLFPDRGPLFYQMTADGPVVAGNLPVQAFPDLVARVGPPLTVSATIDRRDHALDATELLVAGWAWEPGPLSCTPGRPGQPVLDQCPSPYTWLADRKPPPATGPELLRPDGPAINLVIAPESVGFARLSTKPAQVAVLGHFDDRRAAVCPSGLVERCRRNFIVDEILDPGQLALDARVATTVHPAPSNTPKGTASWAADAAGLPEADRANRLISAFPIAVAALGAFEPDLAETPSTAGIDTVWLVHFLDQDVAGSAIVRTRLVIDADPAKGPAQVFDVTADGMSPALSAAP
jgi:hypothetical protein